MQRTRLAAFAFIFVFLIAAGAPAAHAAPGPGSLIKVACPSNPDVNHPCKAVYYYGADGRRHAFPNDKSYFTWYADFSGVQTVSASVMSSIPLGANVTYRPGVKLVKFLTLNNVYAVALGGELRWIKTETVARELYGADWSTKVDDISDAFFSDYRFGTEIAASSTYDKNGELAAAASINDNLDSTYRSISVATERGTFTIDLVKLQTSRYAMITDTGDLQDCHDNCTAKTLSAYALENEATIGIHGSYFCPPDYADCAGKVNTFLSPVYNSAADVMLNAGSLPVHEGPLIAQMQDGRMFFFHRTKDFGNSVAAFETARGGQLGAAVSNYPSLIENGTIIVESETRLDEGQRTTKGTRGGIGFDDRFVYLVVAHSATVVDLASIMKALGATNALNLDGGGSAALLYDNAYKIGPGRLLPNAILFKRK